MKVTLVLGLLALMTCARPASPQRELMGKVDGLSVRIELGGTKLAVDNTGALVYGNVKIESTNPISSVNFDCIGIKANGISSKQTYVDNIASVLGSQFRPGNGVVDVGIYWFIPNIAPEKIDRSSVNLEIRQRAKPCIQL